MELFSFYNIYVASSDTKYTITAGIFIIITYKLYLELCMVNVLLSIIYNYANFYIFLDHLVNFRPHYAATNSYTRRHWFFDILHCIIFVE